MLVAALGYTTLAEGQGGWPSGYLKYGYQLGLTDGLSGIGNDDQLNRAQVAVLIDNALKCPICVSNGYSYNALGQKVPNTLIKDGTGDLDDTKDGYQNLLNYAHDAYLVYGRVSGTFKSDRAKDADHVKYTVEKSDNWDGYSLNASRDDSEAEIDAYKGAVTDADDYLFSYSEAIIQKDSNDEYTLLSLTTYGSSDIVELDSADFKELTSASSSSYGYQLRMYKDSGHSKYDSYKLGNDIKLYVNGAEIDCDSDMFKKLIAGYEASADSKDDDVIGYVADNQVGKVVLVDATDVGRTSTDGYYDYIMVTYYVDGIVDEIDEDSDEITIILSDCDDQITDGEVVLKLDDDDFAYSITLNGEDIDARDLQENDVVSIAYKVDPEGQIDSDAFATSNTYDIVVSRNTVEGRLTTASDEPNPLDIEYTFDNSEVYKLAYNGAAKLSPGTSYVLYLDAFGKIAKADELASSKRYALLENVYTTNGGADYYADIIVGTGQKQSYQLKDKDTYDELGAILMADGHSVADEDKISNRKPEEQRVISYKLTSKNELRLDAVAKGEAFEGDYKASTSKLGSVKISDALSALVDLEEYDKDSSKSYSSISISDLVAGTTYSGYAFGKTDGDKVYQFVLVQHGIGGYNVNNSWAVFVQSANVDTDNGDSEAVTAYVDGELRTIPSDTNKTLSLTAGDVFFYKLNDDDAIDDIKVVSSLPVSGSNYHAFAEKALDNSFDLINSETAEEFADGKTFSTPEKVKDNRLISGPIVEATSGGISIATKAEIAEQSLTSFAIDNCEDVDVASDVRVYVYDYAAGTLRNRVSASRSAASIRKSTFNRNSYVGEDGKDGNIVNFEDQIAYETAQANKNYGTLKYAIAKVVDDEITEILIIVPDTSKD